jgi:hypothetical protein
MPPRLRLSELRRAEEPPPEESENAADEKEESFIKLLTPKRDTIRDLLVILLFSFLLAVGVGSLHGMPIVRPAKFVWNYIASSTSLSAAVLLVVIYFMFYF